jgi:hypothetical protein
MKIYIQEDNCFFLAKKNKKNNITKIIEKLDKYLINKENIIDIYSKQGIYQINENKIHKLNIKTEKHHENILIKNEHGKNVILLIDDSIIEKVVVYQIPYDHVNISLCVHKYSLHNKTKHAIILVIEFIQNNKGIMTPINYYFEYNSIIGDNISNIPTEDINVFLSLLN